MRRAVAIAVVGIAAALPALIRDLGALVGVSLVTYGAWLVFPPAGYIVLGMALLAATVLSARRSD